MPCNVNVNVNVFFLSPSPPPLPPTPPPLTLLAPHLAPRTTNPKCPVCQVEDLLAGTMCLAGGPVLLGGGTGHRHPLLCVRVESLLTVYLGRSGVADTKLATKRDVSIAGQQSQRRGGHWRLSRAPSSHAPRVYTLWSLVVVVHADRWVLGRCWPSLYGPWGPSLGSLCRCVGFIARQFVPHILLYCGRLTRFQHT